MVGGRQAWCSPHPVAAEAKAGGVLLLQTGLSPSKFLHCFAVVTGTARAEVIEQFSELGVGKLLRCGCLDKRQNLAVQPVPSRLRKCLLAETNKIQGSFDCFLDSPK